jgi:hypothetical protein
MTTLRANEIRKVTAQFTIETDDTERDPVKAGITAEFTDDMETNKNQFMEIIKMLGQSFVDLFEKEVE